MKIRAYLYEATNNLIIGDTLIKKGEQVYITQGYRKSSYAKDWVKITKKDGTYLGEYVEDTLDLHNNFTIY